MTTPAPIGGPPPKIPLLIRICSWFAMILGGLGMVVGVLVATVANDVALVAAYGVIFGVGLATYSHQRWARLVITAAWAGYAAWLVLTTHSKEQQAIAIEMAVFAALVSWYFYGKPAVVAYYAALREAAREGRSFGPATAIERRAWWQRNRNAVIGGAALATVFTVAITLAVMSVLKASKVYVEAVRRARADARVTAALGAPIKEGWFTTGTVSEDFAGSGVTGSAQLSIPLSGRSGRGTIIVRASREPHWWRFTNLRVVTAARGDTIDLGADSVATDPPAAKQ